VARVRKWFLLLIGFAAGLAIWSLASDSSARARIAGSRSAPQKEGAAQKQNTAPQYDSSGALIRPQHFETWVFVGSSTGLTYEPGLAPRGAGEFHDVYIRPESYAEFARTGKFPEKTVLVLALYPPEDKVAPARAGYFEGDLEGMASAVKDHERFPDGWAYFNFGAGGRLKETATANPKQTCFSCHQQHAADDNVFVQFYPILRPIMKAHQSASGGAQP
jgi:Cytochrome P460